MVAAFWSHEYVPSSNLTSFDSKMLTVEDVVLAVTSYVVLVSHQERRPRRFRVWPFFEGKTLLLTNEDDKDPLFVRVYTDTSHMLPTRYKILQKLSLFLGIITCC